MDASETVVGVEEGAARCRQELGRPAPATHLAVPYGCLQQDASVLAVGTEEERIGGAEQAKETRAGGRGQVQNPAVRANDEIGAGETRGNSGQLGLFMALHRGLTLPAPPAGIRARLCLQQTILLEALLQPANF